MNSEDTEKFLMSIGYTFSAAYWIVQALEEPHPSAERIIFLAIKPCGVTVEKIVTGRCSDDGCEEGYYLFTRKSNGVQWTLDFDCQGLLGFYPK